tara:strand:+ start:432 stop:740 length:309 start_codon:yes stop_codon:yes gene_type:complete
MNGLNGGPELHTCQECHFEEMIWNDEKAAYLIWSFWSHLCGHDRGLSLQSHQWSKLAIRNCNSNDSQRPYQGIGCVEAHGDDAKLQRWKGTKLKKLRKLRRK